MKRARKRSRRHSNLLFRAMAVKDAMGLMHFHFPGLYQTKTEKSETVFDLYVHRLMKAWKNCKSINTRRDLRDGENAYLKQRAITLLGDEYDPSVELFWLPDNHPLVLEKLSKA